MKTTTEPTAWALSKKEKGLSLWQFGHDSVNNYWQFFQLTTNTNCYPMNIVIVTAFLLFQK